MIILSFYMTTATPDNYTLSLHDALPICPYRAPWGSGRRRWGDEGVARRECGEEGSGEAAGQTVRLLKWHRSDGIETSQGGVDLRLRGEILDHLDGHTDVAEGLRDRPGGQRSEEHTSELQSRGHLVCRLLLEKK